VAEKPKKHAVERKEVIAYTTAKSRPGLQDPPNTDASR
jgi:hypothetical protein